MPNTKTCYNSVWKKQYNFLESVAGDVYSARCTACKNTFKIGNSGISQVKQHVISEKHQYIIQTLEGHTSQLIFNTNTNDSLSLVSEVGQTWNLTTIEEISRAEIIWSLKCCVSNFLFKSNNEISEIFGSMFPDSNIAKGYKMSETKSKYIIQFGICPFVKNEILNDMKDQPFCFMFDETTTKQIKKQYDGYVKYYSIKFNRIVNHYVGSLFLGHCNSEDLKDHFFEFARSAHLNVKYLLHIGMDGPNVNLKFQKLLNAELMNMYGKKIIDIGTCSLHPVHTGFAKGL